MAGLFKGLAEGLFKDAAKDVGEAAAKDAGKEAATVVKSSEVAKAAKDMPKASDAIKYGTDEARPVAKGGKSVVKALPKAAKVGGILGVAAGAFGLAEGAVSSVGGSAADFKKELLHPSDIIEHPDQAFGSIGAALGSITSLGLIGGGLYLTYHLMYSR